MVSCKRCASEKLACRMSSLSAKCGNCEAMGGQAVCEPVEIPVPDFSSIDKALLDLEKQEETVEASIDADEALVQAAFDRIAASRAKQKRLRKQRKLLKKKEKKLFDKGLADVEDIERLEAREGFNSEIASANPQAPVLAEVVDWSAFWDTSVLGDPLSSGS